MFHNNIDLTENLFWEIIHNKFLFKSILNCLSYDTSGSCNLIDINNINWLCDNGYRKTLIHKIFNQHDLQFTGIHSTQDEPIDIKNDKFIKLFSFFKDDDNEELYQCMFKTIISKYLTTKDSIKNMLYSIINAENLYAFKELVKYSNEEMNIQIDLKDESILFHTIDVNSFEISKFLLLNFKDSAGDSNSIPLSITENGKRQIYYSILHSFGAYENQIKLGQTIQECIDEKLSTQLKVKEFLIFLGSNEIRFKSSTGKSLNRNLCLCLYNDCPISANVNVKSLLVSCYAALSLNSFNNIDGNNFDVEEYYGDNEEVVKMEKFLNFTSEYLLNKQQLDEIKSQFTTMDDLELKLNSLSNSDREKVKPLLRMYYTFKHKAFGINSAPLYWTYYGEQDDEFISLQQLNESCIVGQDYNGSQITIKVQNKETSFIPLCINIFKFGSFSLLSSSSLKFIFKIFFDGNIDLKDLLFKYVSTLITLNNNKEKQIKFINHICEFINKSSTYNNKSTINAILFLNLVVSYNDLELVKIAYNQLKDKIFNNFNKKRVHKESNFEEDDDFIFGYHRSYNSNEYQIISRNSIISSSFESVCKFIKSKEVLKFMFDEFKGKNDIVKWDISEWAYDHRIDLIEYYQQLSNKIVPFSPIETQIFIRRDYKLDSNNFLSTFKFILSNPNKYKIDIDSLIIINSLPSKHEPFNIEDLKFVIENSKNTIAFSNGINDNVSPSLIPLFKWIDSSNIQIQKRIYKFSNSLEIIKYYSGNSKFDNNLIQRIFGNSDDYESESAKHIAISRFYKYYITDMDIISKIGDVNFIDQLIKIQFPSGELPLFSNDEFGFEDYEDEDEYDYESEKTYQYNIKAFNHIMKKSIKCGCIQVVKYLHSNYPNYLKSLILTNLNTEVSDPYSSDNDDDQDEDDNFNDNIMWFDENGHFNFSDNNNNNNNNNNFNQKPKKTLLHLIITSNYLEILEFLYLNSYFNKDDIGTIKNSQKTVAFNYLFNY